MEKKVNENSLFKLYESVYLLVSISFLISWKIVLADPDLKNIERWSNLLK